MYIIAYNFLVHTQLPIEVVPEFFFGKQMVFHRGFQCPRFWKYELFLGVHHRDYKDTTSVLRDTIFTASQNLSVRCVSERG